MAKLIIEIDGIAARQVIYSIAYSFAASSIKAELDEPHGTVNAPWSDLMGYHKGGSRLEKYKTWIRKVRAERESYGKALESLFKTLPGWPDVPPAPVVAWRPYTSPSTGKTFPVCYVSSKTHDAARAYADAIRKQLLE